MCIVLDLGGDRLGDCRSRIVLHPLLTYGPNNMLCVICQPFRGTDQDLRPYSVMRDANSERCHRPDAEFGWWLNVYILLLLLDPNHSASTSEADALVGAYILSIVIVAVMLHKPTAYKYLPTNRETRKAVWVHESDATLNL